MTGSALTMTEQELSDLIIKFAAELGDQLVELRRATDAECEDLRVSREAIPPHQSIHSTEVSCIKRAALKAGWYAMAGLATAVEESIERRDVQSSDNWAEQQTVERALNRQRNEAARRRRLEKQGAQTNKESQP